MPQTQNSANLADTISTIQEGAATLKKKDVNFYDYDGALLYSYTAQEAQSLTALPALPQHSGLVAQEWNWTLLEIQSHLGTGQQITVGCTYDTDDGSTEFYLFVKKGTRIPELPINVSMAAQSSAVVYWGDGTSSLIENPSSSSANITVTKTDYAEASADTELCVKISSGSFRLNSTNIGNAVKTFVTRAHIGSNCFSMDTASFCYYYNLEAVTIANTIQNFNAYAFMSSRSIRFVTIPRGTTVVGDECFSGCYALRTVAVPATVTKFGTRAFDSCFCLPSVTIPSGLIDLGSYAFATCMGLRSAVYPRIATGHGGGNSYNGCVALLSVMIPDGVQTIYSSAFINCSGLTYVKIPQVYPVSRIMRFLWCQAV